MTWGSKVGDSLIICPACGKSFEVPVLLHTVNLGYKAFDVTFNKVHVEHECPTLQQ